MTNQTENDKFYIVKKAIYLHGVYGPYDTLEQAVAAFHGAYTAYSTDNWCNDFDGHHDYFIVQGLEEQIGRSWELHNRVAKIHYLPKGEDCLAGPVTLEACK